MFARRQSHMDCHVLPRELVLIHRETGVTGYKAEEILRRFREEKMPHQWEESLRYPRGYPKTAPPPVSPLHVSPVKGNRGKSETSKPSRTPRVPAKRAPETVGSSTPLKKSKPDNEDFDWKHDPIEISLEQPEHVFRVESDPEHKNISFSPPVKIVSVERLSDSSDSDSDLVSVSSEADENNNSGNKSVMSTGDRSTKDQIKEEPEQTVEAVKPNKEKLIKKSKASKTVREDNEEKQEDSGAKATSVKGKQDKDSKAKLSKTASEKVTKAKSKKVEEPTSKHVTKNTKKSTVTVKSGETSQTKLNVQEREIEGHETGSKTEQKMASLKTSDTQSCADVVQVGELLTDTTESTWVVTKDQRKVNLKDPNQDLKNMNKKPSTDNSENPITDLEIMSVSQRLTETETMETSRLSATSDHDPAESLPFLMDEDDCREFVADNIRIRHPTSKPFRRATPKDIGIPHDLAANICDNFLRHLQKSQEETVILRIGERDFHTSKVTMRADPNSLFAAMLKPNSPFRPCGRNMYVIDRDPAHFRHILNYLRNGAHMEAESLPVEKRYLLELLIEARFYMCERLQEVILEKLRHVTGSEDKF